MTMRPYQATAITADGRRLDDVIHARDTAQAADTMACRATVRDEPPRYLHVRRAPTPASTAPTRPAELGPAEPVAVVDGWLSDSDLAGLHPRVTALPRSPAPRVPRLRGRAGEPPCGLRQAAVVAARHVGDAWGVLCNLREIYRHHRRGGCTRRRALMRAVMPLVNDVMDPVRAR